VARARFALLAVALVEGDGELRPGVGKEGSKTGVEATEAESVGLACSEVVVAAGVLFNCAGSACSSEPLTAMASESPDPDCEGRS
jgi:hypothetical protein